MTEHYTRNTVSANRFNHIYVLEWFHESSGEWTAVEGTVFFRNAQRNMRNQRAAWPKEKFRLQKYTPEIMR